MVLGRRAKNKGRNTPKIGTANEANSTFKRAELMESRRAAVHVTRVHKSVTVTAVEEHIVKRCNEVGLNINDVAAYVTKLPSRLPDSYSAFKVSVNRNHLKDLLQADFWPEGVGFRRFIYERPATKLSASSGNTRKSSTRNFTSATREINQT